MGKSLSRDIEELNLILVRMVVERDEIKNESFQYVNGDQSYKLPPPTCSNQ